MLHMVCDVSYSRLVCGSQTPEIWMQPNSNNYQKCINRSANELRTYVQII